MAEFVWKSKEEIDAEKKQNEIEQERLDNLPDQFEVAEQMEAVSLVVRKLIRVDDLTGEELDEIKALYPVWSPNSIRYKKDEVFRYGDDLYKAVYEVVSTKEHTPDITSAYTKVSAGGVIDYWKAPTGYENVYKKGDKVIYKPDGKIYISKIDGNSQEPTKDEPYNRYWGLDNG